MSGAIPISEYENYNAEELLMLLSFEVDEGCHTELRCYCTIENQIIALERALGPDLNEKFWRLICNACDSATRQRNLTSGGGGIDPLTYRFYSSTSLFVILAFEEKSGCHDNLQCFCPIRGQVRAINEALGATFSRTFWNYLCHVCDISLPPVVVTPPGTPVPPVLPPVAPPPGEPPLQLTACPVDAGAFDPADFSLSALLLSRDS